MTELEDSRREKDEFFATDPNSPLTRAQKKTFKGLRYFPENPALRLELMLDEFPVKDEIVMQTSTGDIQTYLRFGRFTFQVQGQEAELTVYSSGPGEYFLPFVDAQAGKETYAAGRYVEPLPLGDSKFLLDFNNAYNPYCAYNEFWSCPIPPAENRLKVPIRAGEKVFHP